MNHLQPQRAATVRWSPRLLNDIVNSPDLATAAEHLRARGIPVFPCVAGGKRPLTAHGFQDASADSDVVNFWWRRWPDANIGVPTGSAGGIDVVDVDVHKTGSGFAAFEHARRAGFVEGWAWLVRTPSGGLHAYFLRTAREGTTLVAAPEQAHRLPRRRRLHHRPALPRDGRGRRNAQLPADCRRCAPPVLADRRRRAARIPRPAPAYPTANRHASARLATRQARWLGGLAPGGWSQRWPVLGGVPDGRGGPRPEHHNLTARRGGVRRWPARARGDGDHPVGVPDRNTTRAGGAAAPYGGG